MEFGQGKYRIDIVKYYSMTLKAFTDPKWFFQSFYPRVPVEIFYTVIAVNFAAVTAINLLLAVATGGIGSFFGALFGYLLAFPLILAVAASFGSFLISIFSQVFAANKLDFQQSWRFVCFVMTFSLPMSIHLPLLPLQLLFSSIMMLAMFYLGYLSLKHFLRVSPTVVLAHNVIAALTLVAWLGTSFAAISLQNKYASLSHDREFKKALSQLQDVQKAARKFSH